MIAAPPAPEARHSDALTDLERRIVDHTFVFQPGYAVFLGLHEYDGRVADLARGATERWADAADRLLRELAALDLTGLPFARRLDATLLQLLLESPLFDLRESRDLDRNPMAYVGQVSLTAYLVREYAPAAQRVQAMVRLLAAVPTVLDAGRQRLDARLPEPFVRLALAMSSGLPAHLDEAEAFARRASPNLGDTFHGARQDAEQSINEFVGRMKDEYLPKATTDFALGGERYQRLLWVREGIRTPFSDVLRAGRADLDRNQARLAEIASAQRPGVALAPAIAALFESVYTQHPTAERLVPLAQEYVEETRRFVREKDLVTIPEPAICRVEETPVYGRALSTASMNPPGPFDTAGDEGIYFVTPVDPAWAPERQEEWLRSLNNTMLRNVTIHEVIPGHYLQFLHFRKTAGTLARKVYLSSSFAEGWAHYCEQLAIEAGLGAGTYDAELAQIHDALLRNCRLIASIGLHTEGWTVAQATQFFQREAHFETLPAEREAIRGTFNPEYFCYTLGKLAILDARSKNLGPRFGGSLRAFHDRLLGFGCPPVGMLESLLEGPA
ncbi:MAG: DUF885 domain-containing protein [Thermoplasmata archaeon]|nr:DUF885 domain-containing protein [Thermoplasmata archaeon]